VERGPDTRTRIENIALALFSEYGYEKTALSLIADRAGMTKAAIYYHFKTKEAILDGLSERLGKSLSELVAWGDGRAMTPQEKRELIVRYIDIVEEAEPLFRFFRENWRTSHFLAAGKAFGEQLSAISDLLREGSTDLGQRVRCATLVFVVPQALFALRDVEADRGEKKAAVLRVAEEMMDQVCFHGSGQRLGRAADTDT
jgi:AcrR family transcriptional regulator